MENFDTYPGANINLRCYMSMQKHDTFKELYESRHEPENLRPIAELYWRAMLVFAVVTAGLIIFFGIWQFSSVISTMSSASDTASAQQKPAIVREDLESALIRFEERRATFELGRTVVPAVADPSK